MLVISKYEDSKHATIAFTYTSRTEEWNYITKLVLHWIHPYGSTNLDHVMSIILANIQNCAFYTCYMRRYTK